MVTREEILKAAERIRAGGLVAFPTETVYGLAANALDPEAVAGIFELKGRPRFDPLIVHVRGGGALPALVKAVPPAAEKLIERFWPGPLSLVLPRREVIPDIVTAGLSHVAVRCPRHEVARGLIEAAEVPLAAPSANRFGAVSPTSAEHVREQFGDRTPLILDAGPCTVGIESTVVSFAGERPELLRPGGVTLEELQSVIGKITIGESDDNHPISPGQLTRHYAPRTRLVIGSPTVLRSQLSGRLGLLSLMEPNDRAGFAVVEVLSPTGSLREAAANLFAAMRRLDAAGLDAIVAEPVPEKGLGRAILDRLQRAAAK